MTINPQPDFPPERPMVIPYNAYVSMQVSYESYDHYFQEIQESLVRQLMRKCGPFLRLEDDKTYGDVPVCVWIPEGDPRHPHYDPDPLAPTFNRWWVWCYVEWPLRPKVLPIVEVPMPIPSWRN